jgi:cysteine desulfurase
MMGENLSHARENARVLIEGLREIPGAWTIPVVRDADGTDGWSPYIINAAFPPLPAEVVVRTAEERGYCISAGAACSSKKKDRTRVPESMGIPPETARCAIRISTGPSTTRQHVQGFLSAMREAIPPLLSISRGRSA